MSFGQAVGACVLLMLACMATLAHRAWQVQLDSPEPHRMKRPTVEQPQDRRGRITDRHGRALAISLQHETFFVDPQILFGMVPDEKPRGAPSQGGDEGRRELVRSIEALWSTLRSWVGKDVSASHEDSKRKALDPGSFSRAVAAVLHVDERRILARLKPGRRWALLKRRASLEESRAMRALEVNGTKLFRDGKKGGWIRGLGTQKEYRRWYPKRELAAHVLGHVNLAGKGMAGVEADHDLYLRGDRPAQGQGRNMDNALQGAQRSCDIELTIDSTIQSIVEAELSQAVRKTEARSGSVIVMAPRTGDVLALANYPTYNPNDPGADASVRRNRAVSDRYEPGSTVKVFTLGAALDRRVVTLDQIFDTENGRWDVGGKIIKDTHRTTSLGPAGIIKYSSNIGIGKVGLALGKRGLYEAFRRAGFGAVTGIQLPAETRGSLPNPSPMDREVNTIFRSFGQGWSINSLQLASAVNGLANGGRLMRPRLIGKLLDGEGRAANVGHYEPSMVGPIMSKRSAALVADMMTGVTSKGGTGVEAALPGHVVAGKTGTAEKSDGRGYVKGLYVSSFVGFVPAREPALTILVTIDEPNSEMAYAGGEIAAPVFRRIANASLQYLGIVPRGTDSGLLQQVREQRARKARLARAEKRAPSGSKQKHAVPEPRVRVVPKGTACVPHLLGQGVRSVNARLARQRLMPVIQGSGAAVRQSPAAGTCLPVDSPVEVWFAPSRRATVGTDEPEGKEARMKVGDHG